MAKNDSAFATLGAGAKNNNPANMRCVDGLFLPSDSHCQPTAKNGSFQHYSSLQEGINENVALYVRWYAGKLPDQITKEWAGNPTSPSYWKDIEACYPTAA